MSLDFGLENPEGLDELMTKMETNFYTGKPNNHLLYDNPSKKLKDYQEFS